MKHKNQDQNLTGLLLRRGINFDELLRIFKQKIEGIIITYNTFTTIILYAMEIIEFTQLKGEEQKTIVILLVTRVIEDSDLSDKHIYLELIQTGFVDRTIEMIISATKGKLNINVKKAFFICC